MTLVIFLLVVLGATATAARVRRGNPGCCDRSELSLEGVRLYHRISGDSIEV